MSIYLLDGNVLSVMCRNRAEVGKQEQPHVVTRQCLSAGWCGVRGAICVMYLSRIEATYNGPK